TATRLAATILRIRDSLSLVCILEPPTEAEKRSRPSGHGVAGKCCRAALDPVVPSRHGQRSTNCFAGRDHARPHLLIETAWRRERARGGVRHHRIGANRTGGQSAGVEFLAVWSALRRTGRDLRKGAFDHLVAIPGKREHVLEFDP